MDVRHEIARKVDMLPPDLQEQVLRYVAALNTSAPAGEKGAACAGSLRSSTLFRLGR
jgi:hypothetical protein